MAESDEKVFAETNVEKPLNENLEGEKSSKAAQMEAAVDKDCASKAPKLDKQPEEVKASADILPEDAELKSEHSAEESSG